MCYVHNGDGTTTLTFGVTNPHRRALDAIAFTSNGWTRQAPEDNSVYSGDAGDYQVKWILHNVSQQEAFRFQSQGNWYRNGVGDRFVLTVSDFDPGRRITAWVRANNRWVDVRGRLSKHNCDRTPPPTPTPTPTPPDSPLPTPTSTPQPDDPAMEQLLSMQPRVEPAYPSEPAVVSIPLNRTASTPPSAQVQSSGIARTQSLFSAQADSFPLFLPYIEHGISLEYSKVDIGV